MIETRRDNMLRETCNTNKICDLLHALPWCPGFERIYARIHGKMKLGKLMKRVKHRSLVNEDDDMDANEVEKIIDDLIDTELSALANSALRLDEAK